MKDTLQTETSDVGLDEVQVLVSVVVLLLQCADRVTLMTDKQVSDKGECVWADAINQHCAALR